jgi:hypothetical protein
VGAYYDNLVGEGLSCDLCFEVRAGFAFCLVVLSVGGAVGVGEGGFDVVGGGGEVMIVPDVFLADVGGEGVDVAAELSAECELLIGERRKWA